MQSAGSFNYEDRYGKKAGNTWLIPAIIFGGIGLVWILWAGLFHSVPSVRSTLYSFSVTGEKEISIKYAIQRKNQDEKITCTLVAYDVDKNVVGQIDDSFDPGEKKVQRNTPIATRSAPVSAAISNCRVA